MILLLLIHAAGTLILFGVILVQLVHDPLFRYVGQTGFAAYQTAHVRRITWIVAPAMITELVTAGLVAWWRPLGVPEWQGWTGLALVLLIWATTALVQVPLHQRLADEFDEEAHSRLLRTNWIRTSAWMLRAGLVL